MRKLRRILISLLVVGAVALAAAALYYTSPQRILEECQGIDTPSYCVD